MDYKEYTTIDRATMLDGPWKDEPDKIQWQDEATGLPCLIVRHDTGHHLCGYVGVAEGHPCYEKEYDQVDAYAHGGLTFSSFCQPHEDEATGVCHVPAKGEPDHVWWLGFDMAHWLDFCPGHERLLQTYDIGVDNPFRSRDEYRDINYVKNECARLAKQLAEMVT